MTRIKTRTVLTTSLNTIMSSEDQEILAKIGQLAGEFANKSIATITPNTTTSQGQINRHKNGQQPDQEAQFIPPSQNRSYPGKGSVVQLDIHTLTSSTANTGWQLNRGGFSSRGYMRGGRPSQVHRNRTLVLNGSNSTPLTTGDMATNDENLQPNRLNPAQAWVSKTDRHMQLINSSIFEKDSQQRAKAMEETRQQKLKQRDEREKARFNKHLHRAGGSSSNGQSLRANHVAGDYEITIQGIGFRVAKNGSKLVKVPGEKMQKPLTGKIAGFDRSVIDLRYPGDRNAAKSTPKTALIGGVRFYRSKTGNMYRSGVIKAYRYGLRSDLAQPATHGKITDSSARKSGIIKKINEPCRIFTTMGIPFFLNHIKTLDV